MTKKGPVYVIPCDRCKDLADLIEKEGPKDDAKLMDLQKYLRRQTKGFFQMAVAEEDNILWPGGPDIRDYQFGGRDTTMTIIKMDGPEAGVYSNQPLPRVSPEGEWEDDDGGES